MTDASSTISTTTTTSSKNNNDDNKKRKVGMIADNNCCGNARINAFDMMMKNSRHQFKNKKIGCSTAAAPPPGSCTITRTTTTNLADTTSTTTASSNSGTDPTMESGILVKTKANWRRSVGRTREWLNKNLDFTHDGCGFTTKFSQCGFGSKTVRTKCVIQWIVLNDAMNDLVSSFDETQKFYVGTGSNKHKFGTALIEQISGTIDGGGGAGGGGAGAGASNCTNDKNGRAVAFFQAPKKGEKTKNLYYVGHWVPTSYELFPKDQPFLYKNCPRQMVIELQFSHFDNKLEQLLLTGS